MSIGEGIGQGLMFAAQNISQNRRADKEQKRQLEMFNLKNAAELTQLQKMEELKYNLTEKKRQRNLDLLNAKYGSNPAITQTNAAIPSSEPISGNGTVPSPLPNSPVQGQANPAQVPPQAVPAMFNPKDWQAKHYQDYIDPDTGSFDAKGFRQGSENASKEYGTLQYLRASGLSDLPDNVNLSTVSPFIGSMLSEKKTARELEQNRNYVTEYAKQNNIQLTPQQISAYATRPGTIESIISNKEQEKRFIASEAHAAKREANASARLEKALSKVGRGSDPGGGVQYIEDPTSGEVLTVKTSKNGTKSYGKSGLTPEQLQFVKGGGKPKPMPAFNFTVPARPR